MRILGIETSCDETSLAIVEAKGCLPAGRQGLRSPEFRIIKNLVSSQINEHRPFGGVVPNIAKREHIKRLPLLHKKLGKLVHDVDLIAVTVGPGLDPALWTGIEFSKTIAKELKKPLVGVNHLAGHIYANWIDAKKKIQFPAVVLIVSGGHTTLLYMESLTKWKKLGETRDDAAGEAFDKVARMLKLSYPGGPEIENLAKKGDQNAIEFPRPMLHSKDSDFSFSGLKTSVLYHLRNHLRAKRTDVAASFQNAVVDVLIRKTIAAAEQHRAKTVLLTGGVAANKYLRKSLRSATRKNDLLFITPRIQLNTDNAAMIAAAGYVCHMAKNCHRITSQPNLTI